MYESIKIFLELIRVKHWIKNILIFAPIIFAGYSISLSDFRNLVFAFFCFSFVASFIYIFNDLVDVEQDKNHQLKKLRPIASGKISLKNAIIIQFFLLFIASTFLFFTQNTLLNIVVLIYIGLNVFYTCILKKISIIDIFSVATFFVMRLCIGGVVSNTYLSKWIIILTFLLALFLVISKRKEDLSFVGTRNLDISYNKNFINFSLYLVSTLILVCYIMYITEYNFVGIKEYFLYSTILVVLIGFLRYFQIVFAENLIISPVKILYEDRMLQIVVFVWILIFGGVLYL